MLGVGRRHGCHKWLVAARGETGVRAEHGRRAQLLAAWENAGEAVIRACLCPLDGTAAADVQLVAARESAAATTIRQYAELYLREQAVDGK